MEVPTNTTTQLSLHDETTHTGKSARSKVKKESDEGDQILTKRNATVIVYIELKKGVNVNMVGEDLSVSERM